MSREQLRIGELAARAGVSVRTLHHYDEIGLLEPRAGGAGSMRVYGAAEIRRLQQIRSLQSLGLSLTEIATCLDAPTYQPTMTLRQQLQRVVGEIEAAQALRRRLEGLLRHFDAGTEPSTEDLLLAIEAQQSFEKHYTPEQLAALEDRARAFGPEQQRAVEAAWREIFAGFEDALDAGKDIHDPGVITLARRAQELVDAFTQRDPGIEQAVAKVNEEDRIAQKMMRVSDEVWAFMQAARQAL